MFYCVRMFSNNVYYYLVLFQSTVPLSLESLSFPTHWIVIHAHSKLRKRAQSFPNSPARLSAGKLGKAARSREGCWTDTDSQNECQGGNSGENLRNSKSYRTAITMVTNKAKSCCVIVLLLMVWKSVTALIEIVLVLRQQNI